LNLETFGRAEAHLNAPSDVGLVLVVTLSALPPRTDSQFAGVPLDAGMSRVSCLSFIPPQLPSWTDQPPEGADWLHEVKHDGYRTMLLVERGTALAYTRNGHDWSDRYPAIITAARKLPLVYAGPAFIALRREAREEFEARLAELNRSVRCFHG
jgi:hypothetical protein